MNICLLKDGDLVMLNSNIDRLVSGYGWNQADEYVVTPSGHHYRKDVFIFMFVDDQDIRIGEKCNFGYITFSNKPSLIEKLSVFIVVVGGGI